MTGVDDSQITQLMKNAPLDLAGHLQGRFSPQDWEKIVAQAEERLRRHLQRLEPGPAWAEVIREFNREDHWGYKTGFKAPKVKKPKNLAIDLIWLTFQSMTATKVAILWAGEGYSNTENDLYKWIFFALMIYIPGNAIYFIWRYRKVKST